MNRFPDFLIIGAMKCATSTLHDQLSRQPGLFMSSPKEIYYFSDDAVYANGPEWYADHFRNAAADDLCGESSTHYTKLPTYPRTVERIDQLLGRIKFIYVMRDPIDRLVSQYIHQWSMREISCSIEEYFENYPALISYSEYARQLRPYFDRFGKENVLPVFFDRLKNRPQAELERVCNFIGYTGIPVWQDDLGPSNQSAQRMRHSRFRDALLEIPLLSHARRHLIPQSARDAIKGFWQLKKRPMIAESQKQRIGDRLDADLVDLSQWFGLDQPLTCQTFKSLSTSMEHSPDWVDRQIGCSPSNAIVPSGAESKYELFHGNH